MNKIFQLAILTSFFAFSATGQTDILKQKIKQVIAQKKANVGVAVYGLESKETLSVNNNHYPMQSVFKFHIALAVLNEVDKGKFSLNQKIHLKKSDLLPDTWSPLKKEYPDGEVDVTLDKILSYTVSQSDNNGCDILLRLIGGARVVNDYIHSLGNKEVSIKVNEEDMHRDDSAQYKNWTTPVAATNLLSDFYNRKMLSPKSYAYLWRIMTETSSGKDRIKGELPVGTVVGHKTGTSGINKQGIYAATNDIGIVILPNGQHFAISVFVVNSKEKDETNAKIIADISRLAWDYFTGKMK